MKDDDSQKQMKKDWKYVEITYSTNNEKKTIQMVNLGKNWPYIIALW